MFRALVVEQVDGKSRASIQTLDEAQLPEGDVTVRVEHSTLNYKDALAITGKAPVVRKFPMVPGIDLAGTVEQSTHVSFRPGDRVLLNGFGVGETHWGGLAQRARVSGDWLLPLPEPLTSLQAMSVGTAGYTAMLCVMALERHGLTPQQGEILVTGANGGVGSFAIGILKQRGYTVVASTGRMAEAERLKRLGASEVIDRATLSEPGKPLARERWAGVVDSVGSHTLVNACASTRYGGAVAACGLAQGLDFPATVAPFILRGVSLLGVDSVYAPRALREQAWAILARDMRELIGQVAELIPLEAAIDTAGALLRGEIKGRVVVDVNA
ncbi:oxidoreductase [Imbroritus primus]|uniref:Oxidoreductase n=1 Tax=Imbroritus primus TaxID=3058603 RepID=A0ACD3SLJ5_9BURK|nr:oxidoreductase [Burkholderiaceae bacterium PBA]